MLPATSVSLSIPIPRKFMGASIPPLIPIRLEGIQKLKPSFDWAEYFSEAIDRAKSFDEVDSIYDHWANCILSKNFVKLDGSREIEFTKEDMGCGLF